MNNGNINLAVLLDFKKAFDVVDHEILCKKLLIYGFHEDTVDFFKSYLSERTQQVHINNQFSDKKIINFGVPQGSILGPILFVLFINDLPLHIKNCHTDLYADDTTMHTSGKTIADMQLKVQDDLQCVEKWCHENSMFINSDKTKCMVIGTRQRLRLNQADPVLTIENNILQKSSIEKLLGVRIDYNLSWTGHINYACSSLSSRLYLLFKIKKFLNIDLRKLFYNGYILPLIDYCCIIWSGCAKNELVRIIKLQKRAARLILDADPLSSSAPLFKQLGWMTVENRISYHKSVLMHKCLKNEAPVYLTEKFKEMPEINQYCLRNASCKNLQVPKAKNRAL